MAGGAFIAYFLGGVVRSPNPSYWLFQSYPIALSVALVALGVLLARGDLVADRFLWRLLSWMIGTLVVFSLFLAWFYALAVMFSDRVLLDPPVGVVTLPLLGTLAGLLIGTYDARALERKQAITQLSKINETLRIANGELVENTDRAGLEQGVCDRLVESGSFDAAWIGRYDADTGAVQPTAWAGFDTDIDESPVVVADGGPDDLWSQVVSADHGRFIQADSTDGSTGQWRDAFERHGIESMAVVPYVGSDRAYGVIGICTEQADAFGDEHQQVLAELGEKVGYATDAIRAHEALEAREQDLLTQNDRLDEFAGIVSHDLRNPLNVILARVSLLQETDEDESLDAIERAGERMEEIIADLLALSRSSRAVVDIESVSLAGIAEESWRTVETADVAFALEVPDTTTIRADAARLRTVFENLFRNSVEHGSTNPPQAQEGAAEHNESSLTVRVGVIETAIAGPDAGSPTGFYVEDDGDGIPEGERESVFDHGYTTNSSGTGFGLSIVRSAVDAHGWDVAVRPGPQGGARFEITGVEFET